jgi:hypothetical protein
MNTCSASLSYSTTGITAWIQKTKCHSLDSSKPWAPVLHLRIEIQLKWSTESEEAVPKVLKCSTESEETVLKVSRVHDTTKLGGF